MDLNARCWLRGLSSDVTANLPFLIRLAHLSACLDYVTLTMGEHQDSSYQSSHPPGVNRSQRWQWEILRWMFDACPKCKPFGLFWGISQWATDRMISQHRWKSGDSKSHGFPLPHLSKGTWAVLNRWAKFRPAVWCHSRKNRWVLSKN